MLNIILYTNMIYKYYIIYIKYILHTYKCYIYYNIHMHPDNFLPLLILDTFRTNSYIPDCF